MTLQTRKPLKAACSCGIKGYPTEEAASLALSRIVSRALRDVNPKKVVECWQGRWHVVGSQRVDTGPDRNTRALVAERDCWQCSSCGHPMDLGPYSVQHRLARGSGGASDPAINSPANLVILCGSATSPGCHLLAESRNPLMNGRGFWLRHGQDPSAVPVEHAAYGWVLLNTDGTVSPWLGGVA